MKKSSTKANLKKKPNTKLAKISISPKGGGGNSKRGEEQGITSSSVVTRKKGKDGVKIGGQR